MVLQTSEEIKAAFDVFDTSKDGKISANELSAILMRGDNGLSQADVDVLLHSFDTNCDGVVSLDEFADACAEEDLIEREQLQQLVDDAQSAAALEEALSFSDGSSQPIDAELGFPQQIVLCEDLQLLVPSGWFDQSWSDEAVGDVVYNFTSNTYDLDASLDGLEWLRKGALTIVGVGLRLPGGEAVELKTADGKQQWVMSRQFFEDFAKWKVPPSQGVSERSPE